MMGTWDCRTVSWMAVSIVLRREEGRRLGCCPPVISCGRAAYIKQHAQRCDAVHSWGCQPSSHQPPSSPTAPTPCALGACCGALKTATTAGLT